MTRSEPAERPAATVEPDASTSRKVESTAGRETSNTREAVTREAPREGGDAPTDRVGRQGRDGRQQTAKARSSPQLAGRVDPGPALTGLVPRALTTSEALKLSTALATGRLATAVSPTGGGAIDGAAVLTAPLGDGMVARLAVDGGRSLTNTSVAQQVADAMRTLEIGGDGDAHFRLNEAKLSVTVERNGADLLVRIAGDDAATRAALMGLIEDVRRALVTAQIVDGEVEVVEQSRDEGTEDGFDPSHEDESDSEDSGLAQSVMEQALRRADAVGHGTDKGDER